MDDERTMNIDDSQQHIHQSFRQLTEHAEELLNATAAAAGDGVAEARRQLEQSIATLRDDLEHAGNDVREKARRGLATADDYVHEKPWQSIAVVFTAGLVLGLMARSHRG
jgi:ElaB/YqjD/DUF883 family membrane-anchored ribosome-binding protein